MVLCCLPLVSEWGRFNLCVFILVLVRFGFLSGHVLGKSCSLGRPYVLFVFRLLVILVISCFGFEGSIWVLISSVPGLCILLLARKRKFNTLTKPIKQQLLFNRTIKSFSLSQSENAI